MKEFETMEQAMAFCYSQKNGTGAVSYNAKTGKYYVRLVKNRLANLFTKAAKKQEKK